MANTFLFADNAQTVLAAPITNSATSAILASGTGALFPSPAAGEQFALTLVDAATGLVNEIVYCTARTGDTLTIVRAQEGTTAVGWIAGDIAANQWTAGQARAMSQTASTSGVLLSTQVISTSGIPSYPAGTATVDMEFIGGGGSGGGVPLTAADETRVASGGGAGAFVKALFAIGTVTGVTLTIGAGAPPGVAGSDGNPGGDTVLAGLVIAPGGTAGLTGQNDIPHVTTGSGNTAVPTVSGAITVTVATPGTEGSPGLGMSLINAQSGQGGASVYGPGGPSVGSTGPGVVGRSPGSGGSGASALPNASATVGGPGASGQVIIRSYS